MPDNKYLRGRTWWGRIEINGRELRRSLRTSDEQQAQANLERWLAEIREDGGQVLTWKHAVVNWMEMVYNSVNDEDGLKPKVKEGYRNLIRPASYLWANQRLKDIGKRHIAEYVKLRKRGFEWVDTDGVKHTYRPVTNASVRRDLTALSNVFRAAVAAGLIDENPARQWDRGVIKERTKRIVPPLPEEIAAVIGYAETVGFRHFLLFAANTGMRKREVEGLEWRDVRAERQEVILPKTKFDRPRVVKLVTPGGNAAGTVAGTPRHISKPWLFWHDDGEAYRSATGMFRALMERAIREEKRAGRELRRFTLHSLRHAFAVRWLLNGGEIHALSKHLGHTSVLTTEKSYLCMIAEYEERMSRHKGRHDCIGLQDGADHGHDAKSA